MGRALRLVLALLPLVLMDGRAAKAHPHVWITSVSELIYAADGTLTGVRHAWTFDDMYATYALQGLDANRKSEYSREELAPLAQSNVEALKEFREDMNRFYAETVSP